MRRLIAHQPVTNGQWNKFLKESRYQQNFRSRFLARWDNASEEEPYLHATREDAEAYCRFYGMSLPTEEELKAPELARTTKRDDIYNHEGDRK